MSRRLFLLATLLLCGFTLSGCGYNKMQSNEEAVFAAWADVEASSGGDGQGLCRP